jgi:UDP-N-acetylmuramoyl-L-alanyl-D-glutamate--2,6-diaminopimelate ligase
MQSALQSSLQSVIGARQTAAHILSSLRERGVEPRGLTADSRALQPGEIFLAYPGARSDGRSYMREAERRGAAALLWEDDGYVPDWSPTVPGIAVRELRNLSGHLAALIFAEPSEKLWLVGVTGTNGKTSVSQWIAQCMQSLGRQCAVIGTLGNGYPGDLRDSPNTTPDAIVLQRDLARFVADGAVACAMEVSSIGLDHGRVDAVGFDVAVFTNLTQDHLDHHGDMANYGAAKQRLFTMPGLAAAIINLDDPFGAELARSLQGSGVRRIGYTLTGADRDSVDELLVATDLAFSANGLSFQIGNVRIEAPLVGRFNAANLLAVFGALGTTGIAPPAAAAAIATLQAPPGRMQSIGGVAAPLVVIDYAHTPDALEQALITLRETVQARGGKLICIFGCGGDRDTGKRPLMGKLATGLADTVWLTSDNPRSEDPLVILAEIAAGAGNAAQVEPDRAKAIRSALAGAADDDIVLIAGKGHETYQEEKGVRMPFSDVAQAQLALTARRTAR